MRDPVHSGTIKTSAPSLEGVIERRRLIDALANLKAGAKWLQSPSGTGKSTLAASYARSRTKLLVWYRLDERDNDPAFFFGEFSDAVAVQLRLTVALPRFSGDDHDRQQLFARRFFEVLATQVDQGALIVLDDMQRLTTESMLSSLGELINLAGHRIELVFVSEATTPIAFFDAIAARRLALLNDADLRFDIEECKAMGAVLRIDAERCGHIVALTGGHAGAVVLACELLRNTDPRSVLGGETVERIHSHLLSRLIDRMPHRRRELLVHTAFVAQLTRPIARELAGIQAAEEIDALVGAGILRRVGSTDAETFEAHGLVRQGLQALARSRLNQADTRALVELTAAALINHDQSEAAFLLLSESASTERAVDVLEQLAERYATNGQTDLLLSSIEKVPETLVRARPWLCFWVGQALLQIDEGQARVWLAYSYAAFKESGNSEGTRLAAASVVIAFGLEYGDLRELEIWIQRHRDAGGESPVAPNQRFEATLLMAVICAAFVEGAYPPSTESKKPVQRLQELLEKEEVWLSDDQRVQAGQLLIDHARNFRSEIRPTNAIIATQRFIRDGVGGQLHRARWLIAAASACFEEGDTSASLDYLRQARVLTEKSNSLPLQFQLGFVLANHWMKAQILPEAAEELRRLKPLAEISPPAERAEFARMMARLVLLEGQHAEGLRWAEDAMRLAGPAGFSGATMRRFDVELAYALAANDRLPDALILIKQHDAVPKEAGKAIANCLEFLIGGCSDLKLLRDGLANAQQINFINLLDRARQPLTRICEAALENGIEMEFVQQLITVKKLRPTPLAGPSWPWPVRVRTLGEFRLEVNGHPYQPTHKAQDKPLELLKLLITCQVLGRESIDKVWITERLWPDADAGSARKSLDMTISRLRRLVECEDAIAVNEGRVRLSSMHVWTDIAPLRSALADVRVTRDEHVAGRSTIRQAAFNVKAVLTHYQGAYFSEDDGPSWLLAGREAIASSVRHALSTADLILNGAADAELVPALKRALLHDPASEDLARSLMRAHLRCGQNSEALAVYRRLREMLSLLMGLAPSVETEDIRNRALHQERAI